MQQCPARSGPVPSAPASPASSVKSRKEALGLPRRCRVREVVVHAALAVILVASWARPVIAQIPGNVDWPASPGGTGVTVGADARRGLNSDSGKSLYVGSRVQLHLRRSALWIGGGYSGISAPATDLVTAGAGFAFALAGYGSLTLAVDGGVGTTRTSGTWLWGAPVGLTLWIDPSASSVIRPFLRTHGLLVGAGRQTDKGFSALAGAEIRTSSGVGLHVALQWEDTRGNQPLGVGAGFSLRR